MRNTGVYRNTSLDVTTDGNLYSSALTTRSLTFIPVSKHCLSDQVSGE